MKNCCLLAIFALILYGCGSIENSSSVKQDIGKMHVAGVGDTVIEVDTFESLPNAFGKADIFGRTRPTGKIIVYYLGIDNGRAVFDRRNIKMQSNATTMNSSFLIIPQTSTMTYVGRTNFYGNIRGNATSSGTITTTAPPIILPPSGSETRVISNNHIIYYVDTSQDRHILVDSYTITINDAEESSLRYSVSKAN